MRPGRKQYTLGSLMVAIAILGVGLAHARIFAELLIGATACFALVAGPPFLYQVVTQWRYLDGREP